MNGADSTMPPRKASWAFPALLGLLVGNGTGYAAGVILGSKPPGPETGTDAGRDTEPRERPADLSHPRFLEGRGWSVSYPANWTLQPTSADRDADRELSLESPGASVVQVWVRDEPCELNQELAMHIVTYASPLLESPTVRALASWGRYPGRGQELQGKLLGEKPGSVRIFAANVGHRSFTVMERSTDEDRAALEPGFRLVQESFTLK